MSDNYINVPYSVLSQKKLNALDKLTFGFIRGFFEGDCIASNSTIASILGVSKRSIQRSISKLKKLKYITTIPVYEDGFMVGRKLIVRKYKE